jgi:hypothetical protein
MASNLMMENGLTLLRKLYPVRRLVHVGDAGKGTVSEYAEWAPKGVIFVISEEDHHQSLSALIESHPGWSSVCAVLAESASERDYFKASNPRESGLLAPEYLAGIWRNIRTLSRHRVLAKTLHTLLENFTVENTPANWVVVNCLPALSVLRGGGPSLDECDVIVARAILDESVSANPASMLSSLDDYLAGRGFNRVSVQEERHPALGSAIFVRDSRRSVSELREVLDAEHMDAFRQAEIARTTIATLQAACDEHEQARVESQHSIEALTAYHDAQTSVADRRSRELDQALREVSEKARLAEERQRQLDELRLEHDRIAQQLAAELQEKAEREALLAEMTSERDVHSRVASQRSSELEQAVRECSEKASMVEERQRQLERLTLEHDRVSQELVAHLKLASDREALVAQIAADRDQQTHLANQRYKEREHAIRECGEKARLAEELQGQLEQLTLEHDRVSQELTAHLKLAPDREALVIQITADRDEQTHLANQRHKERDQALREGSEKARVAEERQRQLERLTLEHDRVSQELVAQVKLASDREALVAQITIDRDAQTRVAHDLQMQVDQSSRVRDQDGRNLADALEKTAALSLELDRRVDRINQLQSALEEMGNSRDLESAELRGTRAQLERLNATADERGARIAKLEEERDDVQARQIRLDREILKAEAQIDLIKDVILRDKAF